jgi:hypothetical protein
MNTAAAVCCMILLTFFATITNAFSIYCWFERSKGTFIRMMTRIIEIVIANGLPTTGKNPKLGIIL